MGVWVRCVVYRIVYYAVINSAHAYAFSWHSHRCHTQHLTDTKFCSQFCLLQFHKEKNETLTQQHSTFTKSNETKPEVKLNQLNRRAKRRKKTTKEKTIRQFGLFLVSIFVIISINVWIYCRSSNKVAVPLVFCWFCRDFLNGFIWHTLTHTHTHAQHHQHHHHHHKYHAIFIVHTMLLLLLS